MPEPRHSSAELAKPERRKGVRKGGMYTDIRKHERGQGMVEYALILVLIALAVIVVVVLFGHQLNNTYSNISNALP